MTQSEDFTVESEMQNDSNLLDFEEYPLTKVSRLACSVKQFVVSMLPPRTTERPFEKAQKR